MPSNFLRLNLKDVVRGLVVAVLVVVLGAVQQALQDKGLDFASYDWPAIFDVAWKAAVAYLGKNFLSTPDGKVLGRIG